MKKRRVDEACRAADLRRAQQLRRHRKRHRASTDLLTSGLLARETELRRPADDPDLGAAAWAAGLVDKGQISFVPTYARRGFANLPCLYVGAEDSKTGMGVVYASE